MIFEIYSQHFLKMGKKYFVLFIVVVGYLTYLTLFLSKFNFNPSAAIELSVNHIEKFQRSLPSGLIVETNRDGYDGQYYYMIASDLRYQHITVAPYRYQRIIYPLLAFILAGGQTILLPWTLLVINFIAMVLIAYLLIAILKLNKASTGLSLLFVFNVAFVISIVRDLPDPLLFLFLLSAIYYWEHKKFKLSCFFFAVALLTKEAALLVYLPFLGHLCFKRDWAKVSVYAWAAMIFFIWQLILFTKFGSWAFVEGVGNLGWPFWGVIQYFAWIRFPKNLEQGYLYYSVLPVFIFIFIQGLVMIRFRNRPLTLYAFILMFQLLFLVSLNLDLYAQLIDGLGRYAEPLFLFSLLYAMEQKTPYPWALTALTILMSMAYGFGKIFLTHVSYVVT